MKNGHQLEGPHGRFLATATVPRALHWEWPALCNWQPSEHKLRWEKGQKKKIKEEERLTLGKWCRRELFSMFQSQKKYSLFHQEI